MIRLLSCSKCHHRPCCQLACKKTSRSKTTGITCLAAQISPPPSSFLTEMSFRVLPRPASLHLASRSISSVAGTAGWHLEQIEAVDGQHFQPWDVAEALLSHGAFLLDHKQGPLAQYVPPVAHLTLPAPQVLRFLRFLHICIGSNLRPNVPTHQATIRRHARVPHTQKVHPSVPVPTTTSCNNSAERTLALSQSLP